MKTNFFCMAWGIEEYEVTSEGINVNEFVNFTSKLADLMMFPIEFNITKDFGCAHNKLKSLRGAPRVVHGDFNCSFNKLTSLHDVPKFIEGAILCYGNKFHLGNIGICCSLKSKVKLLLL